MYHMLHSSELWGPEDLLNLSKPAVFMLRPICSNGLEATLVWVREVKWAKAVVSLQRDD